MKRNLIVFIALFLFGTSAFAQPQRGNKGRRAVVKKEMALQLYSIRDLVGNPETYAKNHVEVFRQLKQLGYTGAEAAHYDNGKFYGVSPEQYKQDLADAGLVAISSHTTRGLSAEELANHDFKEALKWWDQAIAAHKKAGMKYIVSPWADVPKTLAEAKTICDYHNAIGKKCKEAGLLYGYHNHSHEFQKVEDQIWYDVFLQGTDPEYVFFQMDVYWTVMAQKSPVEYFKRYPGRFKMLHIKDKYELGQSGMVGFDAIFRNADTAGLQDYVVEIEGTDGSIDIMEAVNRSAKYLTESRFVKPSYAKK